MNTLLVFLLILSISGCKTANPAVSEPEFMVFPQDNPHSWEILESFQLTKRTLIKKAHEKSWDIEYGFAPNCSKRNRKKYQPKVVEAINRAIKLWLAPVETVRKAIMNAKSSSETIVDYQKQPPELVGQFNIYEKKDLFPLGESLGNKDSYTTFVPPPFPKEDRDIPSYADAVSKLPDLSVVFNCQKGRAFMKPYLNYINMYEEKKNSTVTIPKTKFSFTTLLHEIGHAFGLADTYVDSRNKSRDHMTNTGVHPYTVGNQPISVMSVAYKLEFNSYDDIKPTLDDELGIHWFYIHMNIAELNLETCPPHYQSEAFVRDKEKGTQTLACRPQNPFLFAMLSKNHSTARYLLSDKKERALIDINARTNPLGFTALHYAVEYAPIELIEIILETFSQEIDFTIAGKKENIDFTKNYIRKRKESSPMTALELAQHLFLTADNEQIKERYSDIVDLLLKQVPTT